MHECAARRQKNQMGQCSVENTEADTTQVKWIIIIEVQIAMGVRGRIALLYCQLAVCVSVCIKHYTFIWV